MKKIYENPIFLLEDSKDFIQPLKCYAFDTFCKCFSHPLPCFSILAQDMSSQHVKMK